MKKVGMMTGMKKIMFAAVLGLFALQLGCGGEEAVTPAAKDATDDQKDIANLINGLSDKASQAVASKDYKDFRAMFTKEASPKTSEIAKYKDHMVSVNGDYGSAIAVTGSSAAVPVSVQKYGTETVTDSTWKAAKGDDGSWKLSEAPLP